MATPKRTKKPASKKAPAKKAQPGVDVVELARHYSETCCSLDYKALIVIEEQYANVVLED